MKTRRTAQTGLCSLALFLFVTACGDRGSEQSTQPPRANPQSSSLRISTIQAPAAVRDRLRIDPVTAHMVPEVVTAPGEVTLDLKQVAKITSRIEGQVDKIHVQLGDRVKPGQSLAAISSLQFDQLIEEYLVSKAQADVAENSFRRTEKLRAEDIVSERKLIEDKGRYLETKARFQHVREKLLNIGLQADELHRLERGSHQEGHHYTLTSPIAGTVVAQHIVRGQGLAPGNELFEIVDTSRVWIFANLPIEQARKLKEGDVGTILPKGDEPIKAPLTYLAPVADETTRTIQIRFEIANQQYRLKPREYVDVQLAIASPPTLAIPVSALTVVDNVRGVFIQQETGYAFIPIELGHEGGGWVEVKNGLSEGELVVVDGVFDLKNVLLKEHIGSGEGG
ncbi:MAG TPA: efflux RND transporter periplasmic adaptor subunit [Nitrospiraceae bacterium]|nr:efflux RND transporter periplasmic adaptor subunit [Nitrospiraceae bacterium]